MAKEIIFYNLVTKFITKYQLCMRAVKYTKKVVYTVVFIKLVIY